MPNPFGPDGKFHLIFMLIQAVLSVICSASHLFAQPHYPAERLVQGLVMPFLSFDGATLRSTARETLTQPVLRSGRRHGTFGLIRRGLRKERAF